MAVTRGAAPIVAIVLILTGCGDHGASDTDAARFYEISAELDEAGRTVFQSGAPEAIENYFDQEMGLGEEALGVTPAEIRSDFEAVLAREAALIPVYDAAGYDLARLDEEAFNAVQDQHPIPADAQRRMGAWIDSNC